MEQKNDAILAKLFLIIILLLITSVEGDAQVSRNGNTFTNTSTKNSSSNSEKTQYVWVDTDGKSYEIYISKNGRCFINKVSSKTGNTYKKYLPEDVSRTICKELNREYKEK